MNKIHKIVTARNTAFIEGWKLDTSEGSPVITSIDPIATEPYGTMHYSVEYSNGASVEVKDVVEIWNRPMTAEEESAWQAQIANLPF